MPLRSIPPIDSIIFDLDGTLWDSTATVARAWQAAAGQLDFALHPITQEMVRSITGLPYDVIYPRLFPQLSTGQLEELKRLCAIEELAFLQREGGRLYPGLMDTLQALRRQYPLFIVSNCQSGYIEVFLEHHRLQHFFQDIECFGNTKRSKADNIRLIRERNSLQAPVYVGDTIGDYEASKSNHIPFIYTTFGFGQVPEAHAHISHFDQLLQLVAAG
ncbi:HAD family hydrolase [Cesiribacter andamanensis]|uniref:phosphoglycolate phosphatase n=1 Tax=Cesiribacter andamanensis AMV16 TaxID=1279009 RepID=M7NGR2_9BACT|nr:HAD family hydrolase [Cesiribacter andamanensis]EMR01020.1 Phosphoglycolate phosphatase [Cesiribacter andamanensis AMV16]